MRAEVYKLGRDKAEAERDITARKARLVQHAQLKHLDDFITKGVACYAVDSDYGRVDIVDLKDTKSDNGWRDEFKLLSLYGKSDGQLNWKLHQYSDGSGNSKNECIPCASRNDALAAVAELLDRRWAEWRKDGKLYGLANYAESAAKHGIPVPADVATQIAQDVEKAKVTQLEFAKAELVKAQENLARLEAGLAPTGAAKPWAK